jgi:hypothetical protein
MANPYPRRKHMNLSRTYTRELKDNLNYTATWLPNLKLSLGDVGVLSGNGFTYRTNLKNLGMPFTEGKPGASADYSHLSAGSVRRDIKLAGKAPLLGSVLADADAGISFSFSSKEAIVFLASNCTIRVIADQEPLRKTILKAYEAGSWEEEYVVVTELVSAGATTIIISQGSEGRYELKAKAGLSPSFEAMKMEGNFSLVHDSQIGFNCLATSGMTPLFRCLGIRKGWFRTDVSDRETILPREGAGRASTDVAVEEVEYDDYLDPEMQ